MMSKQTPNEDGFVSLSVRASVLQKMLKGEVLHMTDVHCNCAHSKRTLQNLLLKAVADSSER